MKLRKRIVLLMLGLGAACASLLPFLLREVVLLRYAERIVDPEWNSADRTAVVFGAAVRNGYPSTMLRDRLDTAIDLYKRGLVNHLLMSGDGQADARHEPAVMANYAMRQGIPEEAITQDPDGLRTYDTCVRALEVYNLRHVVLVTQQFHLPRALFTCEALGIDAVGVAADKRTYRRAGWYDFRELLALTVAAWDVIVRPVPDGGLGSSVPGV